MTKIGLTSVFLTVICVIGLEGCAHRDQTMNAIHSVPIQMVHSGPVQTAKPDLQSHDPGQFPVSLSLEQSDDIYCLDTPLFSCDNKLSLNVASATPDGDVLSVGFLLATVPEDSNRYSSSEQYSQYVKGNRKRLSKFLKEAIPIQFEYKFHHGPKVRLGADLTDLSSKSPLALELRHSW